MSNSQGHANPNILLGNTIELISALVTLESDPKVLVKLKRITADAKYVKTINMKTYMKIPQLKNIQRNISRKIKQYKQTQNTAINRRAIKTLSKSKLEGGYFGYRRYYSPYYSPYYGPYSSHYFAYGRHPHDILDIEALVGGVLLGTVFVVYLADSVRNVIVSSFTENQSKTFLEASAFSKPNNARRFVNICMLSGLSSKTDVTARLDSQNPKLITDLIRRIKVTNDDFANIELLPGLLMSGYSYAINTSDISKDDLDVLVSNSFGFSNHEHQSGSDVFELKDKLDNIAKEIEDTEISAKYTTTTGQRVILSFIHQSLDRIMQRMRGKMTKVENTRFRYVYHFIHKCNLTLTTAQNNELFG